MKPNVLRRLETLERVKVGPEPIVILISPIQAPGHEWECSAYVCQHTDYRVERAPSESMTDFVERAECEAEQYATDKRPPFMLLHPDELASPQEEAQC